MGGAEGLSALHEELQQGEIGGDPEQEGETEKQPLAGSGQKARADKEQQLSEIIADNLGVHLRRALVAVVKDDRDLGHPEIDLRRGQNFEADLEAAHLPVQAGQPLTFEGEKPGHRVMRIGKESGRQGGEF